MNVIDCWPKEDTLPLQLLSNSHVAWQMLFELRIQSYVGFAQLEEFQGFLRPQQSLSTTWGQEMVRILFARGIEEMLESRDSNDKFHFQEEMIDALNYLMAIPVLDPLYNNVALNLHAACENGFREGIDWCKLSDDTWSWDTVYKTYREAGTRAIYGILDPANDMLEKLRNRAWQNSPQSTYFDGWPFVARFLRAVVCEISKTAFWGDWKTFVEFFVAKDKVLQFRLRSKY